MMQHQVNDKKTTLNLLFLQTLKINHTVRGVAQPGSVSAWGAGGRWFESSHPDTLTKSRLLRDFLF